MSQGYFWALIIGGAIQSLIVLVVVIYLAMRYATRHYLQTEGTIITSRADSRRTGEGLGRFTEITSTPFVEYEYEVDGKSYRHNQIMLGGVEKCEMHLDSVLERYPVGTKVVVHYDPADPQRALLERGLPPGTLRGQLLGPLVSFGPTVGAVLIYTYVKDWFVAAWDASPAALCFGGVAAAILLYAIGITLMALRASRWPTTPGKISLAFVETVETGEGTKTKPNVTYVYEVKGRKYKNGRVYSQLPLTSNNSTVTSGTLAKYAAGTPVVVHYNPKSPSESVLHPWSAKHVVAWLFAAGFAGFAWMLMNG